MFSKPYIEPVVNFIKGLSKKTFKSTSSFVSLKGTSSFFDQKKFLFSTNTLKKTIDSNPQPYYFYYGWLTNAKNVQIIVFRLIYLRNRQKE